MKEKLFVECRGKWFNITSCQKLDGRQQAYGLDHRTDVPSLANLASSLVLPSGMGMHGRLRNEQRKHHRQAEGCCP